MIRAKTGWDVLEALETAHEKPSTDQQHHSRSDFRGHENATKPMLPWAGSGSPASFVQAGAQIKCGGSQGWNNAKYDAGENGKPKSEKQNTVIQGDDERFGNASRSKLEQRIE